MEKYQIVYYSKNAGPKYAIATNSEGKYGILSGYETIDIDTGDIVFEMCGVICPFIYDVILAGVDQYYRTDESKPWVKFDLYTLRVGKKKGLFSTLYGAVILKPIPINQYLILDRATTEGLVGCIKQYTDSYGHCHNDCHVFLNCEGEEVITLEKGWHIRQGFQGEEASIENNSSYASINKHGVIKKVGKKTSYYTDDIDAYEIESMSRDAFENDPGAEWNID